MNAFQHNLDCFGVGPVGRRTEPTAQRQAVGPGSIGEPCLNELLPGTSIIVSE